jgi:hypothetical protein
MGDENLTELNQILCFTNYVGMTEVMAIDDANKAGVDFILINPFKTK